MYKGCIFDLDGTLINTIHALNYTVNLTLGQCGLGLVDEEHTKIFVGDGYKKLIERALVYCGDRELVHYEEALKRYNTNFEKHSLYKIEAYDGIKELLAFLKDRGIKIAVVTNKGHDRAVENVEYVFGKGYFDLITGEGEGVKVKPDPSGVFKTMEKLQLKASECLYLGDTNTDMKTGKNAGVDTVGVTWGFRSRSELEEYAPEYIVNHPVEIKAIIGQKADLE